jgi:hypothetical protein
MLTRKDFFVSYLHSMLIASTTFGFIRGMYMILVGIINVIEVNISIHFRISALITVIFVAIIQSSFFFIIGILFAYFPSYFFVKYLLIPRSSHLHAYVFSGTLMGILSLPLCASVAYLVPYAPDLPRYLARCAEYALPMATAGAAGGYFFWYATNKHCRRAEL